MEPKAYTMITCISPEQVDTVLVRLVSQTGRILREKLMHKHRYLGFRRLVNLCLGFMGTTLIGLLCLVRCPLRTARCDSNG